MDSRFPGTLDPPMIGRFHANRGLFFGRRHVRGASDPCPFHLDADLAERVRLGTGILGGWRKDVGDELDDAFPPRNSGVGGEPMRLTLVSLLVKDQEEAARFYVDRLGFAIAEDNPMGDERWLLVRPPATREVAISLTKAKTTEQLALVGRQAADQPLLGLGTDDCRRDYAAMKSRGVVFEGEPQSMPFGTGVMLRDLYGNKLFLNEEPR